MKTQKHNQDYCLKIDSSETTFQEITINEHKFIIKYEKGYFVIYPTTNLVYPWLDKLNYQSIIKKLNKQQIESQLKNNFASDLNSNSNSCKSDKNNLNKLSSTHFERYTEANLDIDCIKESKKIRDYIDDSIKKTPFVKDMHTTNEEYNLSLKIFNRKQCADIIINDYIKLFRWLKSNFVISHDDTLLTTNTTSISLINKSIYEWRIRIDCSHNAQNFALPKVNFALQKEWDYVMIDIKLHPDMYPNYPPTINVVHPKFKNDLNMRISRSKFTMLDYWDCENTVVDVVTRTLNLLQKHGDIDLCDSLLHINNQQMNISKMTRTLMAEISSHLENLNPHMDLGDEDDIDKDRSFIKITDIIASKRNNDDSIKKIKKKGIIDNGSGYGHSSAHKWDIGKYHNLINERNNKFTVFVNSIIIKLNRIFDLEHGDISCTIDLIKTSQLYKFIVKIFKNVSILEIQNDHAYYRSIFDLIHLFCLDSTIRLFYNKDSNKALYNSICNLKQRAQVSLDLDESNENANMINIIHNMIDEPYKKYVLSLEGNKHVSEQIQTKSAPIIKNKDHDAIITYNTVMSKYRYNMDNELHNDKSYFFRNKVQDEDSIMMKQCYKRLSSEIPSLIESLNVSENALVIGCINKKHPKEISFDWEEFNKGC